MSCVVLLPGMMCDARLWRQQAIALEAAGHDVQIGDLTGGASISAIASRVLENCPARFALAGLSMGGIVAFEMWRQDSQRISHLALLDTNPHAETATRRAMRADEIAGARAGRLRELVVEEMKPRYLAAHQRDNVQLRELVTSMALDLGAGVFERQSIAIRDRSESTQMLESISVPALVLRGREDDLCPLAYHLLMAERIPYADLVVLANAGHLPPLEQPEATSLELLRWLARESLTIGGAK